MVPAAGVLVGPRAAAGLPAVDVRAVPRHDAVAAVVVAQASIIDGARLGFPRPRAAAGHRADGFRLAVGAAGLVAVEEDVVAALAVFLRGLQPAAWGHIARVDGEPRQVAVAEGLCRLKAGALVLDRGTPLRASRGVELAEDIGRAGRVGQSGPADLGLCHVLGITTCERSLADTGHRVLHHGTSVVVVGYLRRRRGTGGGKGKGKGAQLHAEGRYLCWKVP
mmetsp:Transcript_68417/g.189336  ORF Transcript_68417/g.189336 Transcript_68417/m.189336 type:complete len:222 (-) Transcript_68417:3-668(-)